MPHVALASFEFFSVGQNVNEPASFDEKEAVTTARKPLQARKQWGYSVAAAKVAV